MSNVDKSVPKSNFEGTFSIYVFGKFLFLALPRPEKWELDIATFIMRKNIKYFVCVEVSIFLQR